MNNSFIKLDRRLIRVLGLNNAVVFCHLLGIQKAINTSRGKEDAIYQQKDRLIYDLGLSKGTIEKSIKYLESIRLLHKIEHTEGNKNKFLVDSNNYNFLMETIGKLETTPNRRNKQSADIFKTDVLNIYYEYVKNNTKSNDNFDTTKKDLIKKEKTKNKQVYSQLFSNNRKPITINYLINGVYKDSITYTFIPLFFDNEYKEQEIYKLLNTNTNIGINEINILEYFLFKYYQYYGKIHKQEKAPKIREVLQLIHQASDKDFWDYEERYQIFKDIIDEYFNTKNYTRDRDLTIYLFLSNDNGYFSWINTLASRLAYLSEDEY